MEDSLITTTTLSKHVIYCQLYFSANGETKPLYPTGQGMKR